MAEQGILLPTSCSAVSQIKGDNTFTINMKKILIIKCQNDYQNYIHIYNRKCQY